MPLAGRRGSNPLSDTRYRFPDRPTERRIWPRFGPQPIVNLRRSCRRPGHRLVESLFPRVLVDLHRDRGGAAAEDLRDVDGVHAGGIATRTSLGEVPSSPVRGRVSKRSRRGSGSGAHLPPTSANRSSHRARGSSSRTAASTSSTASIRLATTPARESGDAWQPHPPRPSIPEDNRGGREVVEEPHSCALQHSRQIDMDLVAQPGVQPLPDRSGAVHAHGPRAGSRSRSSDDALLPSVTSWTVERERGRSSGTWWATTNAGTSQGCWPPRPSATLERAPTGEHGADPASKPSGGPRSAPTRGTSCPFRPGCGGPRRHPRNHRHDRDYFGHARVRSPTPARRGIIASLRLVVQVVSRMRGEW